MTLDDGFIYVADSIRDDIQVFDKSTLGFVAKFGSIGTDDGQFQTIQGIAVNDGFIYVVDDGRDDVQILSSSLRGARF